MNVDAKSRCATQFSLRSLMAAILVFAIIAANWRVVLAFTSGFFWPTTLAVVFFGFAIGQKTRSTILPDSSHMFLRLIIRLMLFVFVALSVTAFWFRYRWYALFDDSLWPRPFPYPDAMLLSFHDWVNAKYPAPSDFLKIHGEFYFVLATLNVAAWIASSFWGLQLGLLFRATIPVGLQQWRDKLVALIQRSVNPNGGSDKL